MCQMQQDEKNNAPKYNNTLATTPPKAYQPYVISFSAFIADKSGRELSSSFKISNITI